MKNHHDLSNGHSPLSFSSRENELAVLEQKTKSRILCSRAARDEFPPSQPLRPRPHPQQPDIIALQIYRPPLLPCRRSSLQWHPIRPVISDISMPSQASKSILAIRTAPPSCEALKRRGNQVRRGEAGQFPSSQTPRIENQATTRAIAAQGN
jgi:hypothetical protein